MRNNATERVKGNAVGQQHAIFLNVAAPVRDVRTPSTWRSDSQYVMFGLAVRSVSTESRTHYRDA